MGAKRPAPAPAAPPPLAAEPSSALLAGVVGGQWCPRKRRQLVELSQRELLGALPPTWAEREYDATAYDKAFACTWIGPELALVGTKCNTLVELDTATGAARAIPTPPAPPRAYATDTPQWGNCGIHSLSVNPRADMVALSGADPADLLVLRLPDYRAVATLCGHRDWVFDAAWLSDRHVATGSRDRAVAVWEVEGAGGDEAGGPAGAPRVQMRAGREGFKYKGTGRVRAMAWDARAGLLAALYTEGCVRLLDPARGLRAARAAPLPHAAELTCMASGGDALPHALAVGGADAVALLDTRRRDAVVDVVRSPDGPRGVRAVDIAGGRTLALATGAGTVAFYDLRARGRGPLGGAGVKAPAADGAWEFPGPPPPAGAPPAAPAAALRTGRGWYARDATYWDYFAGQEVAHAAYSLAWQGARLLAVGGPLAFGLRGCYMGLWR